ncbi:hypothetical protein F5Y04DRAFT_244880 [Hypomontagnella monticulosa]|nr:hypothetical protein F5Y04DRAFT_244880 [Hypomontagnella monticulosa]
MKVIKQPPSSSPLGIISNHRSPKDDWEDWEDSDEEIRVISDDKDGLLIDLSDGLTRKSSRFTTNQTILRHSLRHSIQRPLRVKSKARQKAQNAKAGIKLVTDMSQFRRQAPATQQAKFADAAALHALEGAPSSASIGSFSWLKQKPGGVHGAKARGPSADLSPGARPIVIGIAVPSDNLSDHQVSPHTAVIDTPIDMHRFLPKSNAAVSNPTAPTPQQLRSVWSPDTEASESPYQASRAASSIYSQPSMYGGPAIDADVPPVPALPPAIASKEKQQVVVVDLVDDDDDVGTPCTLFEEDGSPTATRKSAKPKATIISPESASSPSRGWWDHVTTPFLQQTNPFKQQTQDTGSSTSPQQWNPFKKIQEAEPSTATAPKDWWVGGQENAGPSQSKSSGQQMKDVVASPPQSSSPPQEWWSGVNEKGGPSSVAPGLAISTPAAPQQLYTPRSIDTSSRSASPARIETRSEKARVLLEENRRPSEEPPPYSPPKTTNHVKYGVILPPSHVVSSERVPSPGPMTPGLPGTMTSQGAINMAEIPLTPHGLRPVQPAVLPDRMPGSYIPGDHFYEIRGPANRTEKQRRRHEKEEAVARKVGGFWRGRGCIPNNGCFGRSGREGRKRRRVWFGVIAGIIAAIILAIVLAIVFTRPRQQNEPPFSIWLNLTDYPPMPTGVMTVSGPENSLARSGCLISTPETAWSCSLPKEVQDLVVPHRPDQPEFIFQIQYDNNTRALWNISNEDQVKDQKFLTDAGFSPNPAPPTIADMRFLGNTTDNIQEDDKAGEPTPFFISILASVNKTVGPTMLSRRAGSSDADPLAADPLNLPPPALNGDGTVAPTQLFPHAVQQPVRLFDRGLPTEHYGFYTYFDKTIFMVDTVKANAADNDGGCPRKQAKSIVTFAQSRFLVQIWTRMENNTLLLGSSGPVPWTNGSASSDTPGTMPYPVTVTSDMHGGDPTKKVDYRYGILENQTVNLTDAQLILSNRAFAGTLVNGNNGNPNMALGGIDGGTGGCKCEWVNFKGLNTGGSASDA